LLSLHNAKAKLRFLFSLFDSDALVRVNRMKKNLLLLIPILITLIVGLSAKGGASSPGTATVAQQYLMNYETTCTDFTINLTVKDAEDTQMWDANITFDPTVLEVVSAAEGPFIKSGAPLGYTFFDYVAPAGEGYIYIGASYYYIMDQGNGVNGSGILANITFHVLNHYKPPCPINITFIEGETILWYNNGTALDKQPCTTRDGYFTLPGDIDLQGDVDSNDLYLFARAYGTSVGNPTYDHMADFDTSGAIDFDDLILFAGKYGQEIPAPPP